jgi:hypothetical protein
MDFDEEQPEGTIETGSDELLSDDNLRLPESASTLVRVHAVRAWLTRRQRETGIEIGEAALALQEAMQEQAQESRLRRRARELLAQRLQSEQQAFQDAQQRLHAYEEAQELLDDCLAHTTIGERVLVEYYLTLDDLVNSEREAQASLSRLSALADVQHRIEHVGAPSEE